MTRAHLTVLMILVLGTSIQAQETTGNIQGRLRTEGGEAIVGAPVNATSPDLLGVRRAVSASDGVFRLLALPPGTYAVRIAAIGYRPMVIQNVQVQLGKVTGLGNLAMDREAVSLGEITITAPRITLDPVGTTIGGVLEPADYATLPTNRDYKSLITIFPHINTSYHGDPPNAGGSTGLENTYFIDGVNVTAPFRASRGTSLPYNFIRNVEVRAGGYEAQYGRALGAIVNAVTWTGSNTFEASLFGFLSHSALEAEPRAQATLRETGSYSYDLGLRISGRVVKDRLWFSAAYNPQVSHADREIGTFGEYTDRFRADLFAGKLTWQVTSRANLELSVFGDRATRHEVAPISFYDTFAPLSPDPFLHLVETGGVAGSMRGLVTVSDALTLEGALSRSSGRENLRADTERARNESPFVDPVTQHIGGGIPFPSDVSEGATTATARATLRLGRHTWMLGAEHEVARATRTLRAGTGPDGTQIIRTEPDLYIVHAEGVEGTVRNRVYTAYLQDSWRAADRLTLNAGIRWSAQHFIGQEGILAQRFDNEWQPRLGFAWQIDGRGTQRLFGSYGRFYQQDPLNLATLYYLDFRQDEWYYRSDPRLPGATPFDSSSFLDPADTVSLEGVSAGRFDEVTLGFERLIGSTTRLTIRGIYRHLGTTFQQGVDPDTPPNFFLGTPGIGSLAFLPSPRRNYTALEVSLHGSRPRLRYQASYVLSRVHGNYTGLYGSDVYFGNPGVNYGLNYPAQAKNSTGLLPNDRTHVLKLAGSYQVREPFTVGVMLAVGSGTPLNEFGVSPQGGTLTPVFLVPRGSAGRTAAIWDLNLRLGYRMRLGGGREGKALLDVVHLGNPRTAVRVDQQHYYGADRTLPNAGYLRATAFQPPMAVRLGFEAGF